MNACARKDLWQFALRGACSAALLAAVVKAVMAMSAAADQAAQPYRPVPRTPPQQQLEGLEPVAQYSWSAEQEAGRLTDFQVQKREGETPSEALVVPQDPKSQTTVRLLTIDNLNVIHYGYRLRGQMLRGQIRYNDIAGDGYLAVRSYFHDRSVQFSPSIGTEMDGSSDWRKIEIFISLANYSPLKLIGPRRIEVDLVLPPGHGSVELGPLELMYVPEPERAESVISPARRDWWSPREAGRIGAILGCALGLAGALIGVLAHRPRGSVIAQILTGACLLAGGAMLSIGVVAWFLGQPYAVYYPLLIVGLVAVLILGSLAPMIRRLAREHELRRMQALDAL